MGVHEGIGSVVAARELTSVSGAPVPVPDPRDLVHLQFRRFAGCPVCNLHLRSVVRRHAEIEAAGVREVVVFHSPAGELLEHVTDLPFAVVADPDKRLYREFGVESAPRSLAHPKAWPMIAAAVLRSGWAILSGRERGPAAAPHGGRFGLPAEFLIAGDGTVLARKYGEHVYDQWSVDELLRFAAR
ncbi:peroxiredoxin-like family protein [Amycolatopsis cihanbeyliensis]|uniref:Alkyl-hydroperoxide reductase/thiol specific antioxidant family protein n=1 Tax=Amycolatopsis cihanbeyliensis TaxID=1128664 RepID=A0A542DPZ3_AMYCI|nr:peroxiredoxin-like family protein [Amycolatopsis cihanbeyliensis]TQJ05162.1 alkyl-hydroperoxide reductase/thiol specific antioxidant family protein [Amycolatopsis cihanbeyliensis]